MHPVKERLLARTGRGARYGLERMASALESVGHPERGLPIIHVAGTNGKGSVCAMLDAMARAAGLTTGAFTSPHLCRLNERIRVDGEPLEDARFAGAVEVALGATPELTFFETMTVAGFVAMRDAAVDLAIVEVGLGGRLDATNVIEPPLVAVISSIGLDHTRLLGEDVAAIAREKAGILKPGTPVVLGALDVAARRAILEVAQAVESGPIIAVAATPAEADTLAGEGLAVVSIAARTDRLELSGAVDAVVERPALAGPHQRRNAATAAAAIGLLEGPRRVSRAAIEAGIASARWPGRLERVERDGVVFLLDCAHNLHAAEALAAALDELGGPVAQLVFGAMDDKDWREMLALIGPRARTRRYAVPLEELAGRAPASPQELARVLPGEVHASAAAAVEAARAAAAPGDTVLVTGSIFLVGAVRAWLTGEPNDVAVPL